MAQRKRGELLVFREKERVISEQEPSGLSFNEGRK